MCRYQGEGDNYIEGSIWKAWIEEGSVSEKWEVLKSAMRDEAEEVLGQEAA